MLLAYLHDSMETSGAPITPDGIDLVPHEQEMNEKLTLSRLWTRRLSSCTLSSCIFDPPWVPSCSNPTHTRPLYRHNLLQAIPRDCKLDGRDFGF